jgi:ribonuclease P protein component
VTTGRLRSPQDIAAVFRNRRQRAGRLLAVHVRERREETGVRVAVVASRRVGAAVARNRSKRLLREAARSVTWVEGMDVVLVARPACAASTLGPVREELVKLASELGAVRG